MPSNKDLSVEDEELLEQGGGVKADTLRRRKKAYEDLDHYVHQKTGETIASLLADKSIS